MARPVGSKDSKKRVRTPPKSLLQANEFAGQHHLLRLWNTANVAYNMLENGWDTLAERYLEMNLTSGDTEGFEKIAQLVRTTRKNHYTLFGASVHKHYLPRWLIEQGVV